MVYLLGYFRGSGIFNIVLLLCKMYIEEIYKECFWKFDIVFC